MKRKRPTLKQVAEKAGFSTAVVSTVLNNSKGNTVVSEVTRAKVLEIARELGYRANAGARMMKNKRSYQIGVLLKNTPYDRHSDMAVMEFLLGINEGLLENDYVMSLIRLDDIADSEGNFESRAFRELLLEGMIVVSSFPFPVQDKLTELMGNVVWLDTTIWNPTNCLRRDESAVGHMVATRMIEKGYKRLLYLSNPDVDENGRKQTHFSHFDRYAGVLGAAQAHGVDLDRATVPWTVFREPFPDIQTQLEPDTGVITYNSSLAKRVAYFCLGRGLAVPADFGLASCDITQDQSATWPELSGATFARYDMGVEAAEMMMQILNKPERVSQSRKLASPWHDGETTLS